MYKSIFFNAERYRNGIDKMCMDGSVQDMSHTSNPIPSIVQHVLHHTAIFTPIDFFPQPFLNPSAFFGKVFLNTSR